MDPLRLLGLTEHHIIPVCCNPIHPMGFSNWSWGLFNTFCFSRWTLPILAGETHKCKDLQQQCIVANLYIIAMMTKFWRGHSVMLCTRDGLCELHSQGRTVRCRGRHQTCIRIQRCPHPLPHNAHTDFFEVSHVTLPFCSVSSCKHFIQCRGVGGGGGGGTRTSGTLLIYWPSEAQALKCCLSCKWTPPPPSLVMVRGTVISFFLYIDQVSC